MTGITVLQAILSASLFLVLWGFLNPIIKDFLKVIEARMDKTDRTEGEVFGERLELKELNRELLAKQQQQSAKGVHAREEIIEAAKANMLSATKSARDEAVVELDQFRDELKELKSKLEREIESESLELSKVIIEKVSSGSGLNPQTVH